VETDNPTPVDSFIGAVIGEKYRVTSKLGYGGIGAVYLGEHTLMRRPVAIKVLHPHLVESEEFLKRFRHEAEVASRLSHPNAVMIYDFGVEQNRPYLVMEYLPGETLKQWVAKRPQCSLSEICGIFEQVGSALKEAHRLGIIHRDLKPDNIIIVSHDDGTSWAKVLDFGIAKVVHEQGEKGATIVTQAGMFYGTPRYASPEQILGKELDARSDLYSLGVILFEVLSGEPPFDAPSMMEVFLKHLNQEPPALCKLCKRDIPAQLEAVVLKSLSKDPDKRYASVEEFVRELKSSVGQAAGKPGTGAIRREKSGWLFALIVVVLLAVFFAYRSKRPEKEAGRTIASVREDSNPTVQGGGTAGVIAGGEKEEKTSAEVDMTKPAVTSTPAATLVPTPTPEATPEASLDVDGLYSEGKELYRRRQYEEAAAKLEEVVKSKPTHVDARLVLGICSQRLKRYEQALEQFSKALEVDRNHAPTYYNLACLYAVTGEPDKAIKFLKMTIALDSRAKQAARQEPDFASLRGLPEFRRVTER
jgi:tRNA A-37 threonylcarbamoyl transferase component Bud32